MLFEEVRKHHKHVDHEALQKLENNFTYVQLDFDNPEQYQELARIAQELGTKGLTNRLVYCSTASDYFCTITNHVIQSGIVEAHNLNHRIVYEKPFGWNLASARQINACIKKALDEKQVYRIDHYLAKEFVNNILLLRSTNALFKNSWNKESIESVKIVFDETLGVEGRGIFYDRYGAVRDVFQNHILQLLALVAIEPPTSLDSEALRDRKADILKSVRVVDGILGQYKGYHDEPGVKKDSKTETYAALQLEVDTPQWRGIPFYVETGKCLAQKTTAIKITLKPLGSCIWSPDHVCSSNIITINLTPEEGFSLTLNSKKPGTQNELTRITFDAPYAHVFGPSSVEAYEILLQEIMNGQQSIVVRFDEIEYQWRITDEIYTRNFPLIQYQQGSSGPDIDAQIINGVRT
jgi:glucose-6-phosphate 1-dehydrogenase